MTAQIDFDLHGIVGIRLLNATEKEASNVTKQLGPIRSTLTREPDITIRFVDQLPISSKINYLGLDDVGFTNDMFLVLRSKFKAQARVQIPFERIGEQCEIVCERGLPAVPLLVAIINLTALGKGYLPLHASAFVYEQTGIVTTGWSKGGKTESLLVFMAHGAQYIGDEWIYFSPDGKKVHGIPEPIRVWNWHLDSLPRYRALLKRADRTRLGVLDFSMQGINKVTASSTLRNSSVGKTVTRAAPLLKKQMHVDLTPHKLFGEDSCPLAGPADKIFFVGNHERSDITVEPVSPQTIAKRMVFSLQEEQMPLTTAYLKFRFAFPDATNELLEESRTLQSQILEKVLSEKEAYEVYHPYPVSLSALYDAMQPYCTS